MSVFQVTTRISRKWLERKTKHELASIIMANLDSIDLFASDRGEPTNGAGKPLSVTVNGHGELVISVGAATLASSLERQEDNNPYDEKSGGFKRLYRVNDAISFAKDVGRKLSSEAEDGSTPLTDLLDRVCFAAIEDGCLWVDEDGNRHDAGQSDRESGAGF